jgi:hypothetical protein
VASQAIDEGCPEGTALNPDTGVCETGFTSTSSITGYKTVVVGTVLVAFMLVFWFPHLRKKLAFSSGGRPPQSTAARFREYGGQRTSEEELGLVQAADLEDDDML